MSDETKILSGLARKRGKQASEAGKKANTPAKSVKINKIKLIKIPKQWQNRIFNVFWPVLLGIVIIWTWETGGVHALLGLRPYQLPVPSQMLTALFGNFEVYMLNARATMIEALAGLAIGSVIGFAVAVIATWFPKWGYGGLTLLSTFNAIPIIALAPVMNNWFGMGIGSKIAVVVFCSMTVMAINGYRGLNDLKPFALDLMKANAATKGQIFTKLRLPNCTPYVLTALKISTTSSIVAAIVSEFFSSYEGIGFQMSTELKVSHMPEAWAYIILASLCGIILYAIVSIVEHYAIKWHESQR